MRRVLDALMSLVGAAIGVVVGVAAFDFLIHQGLYGMVLPGACLGLGCQLGSRDRSLSRGILCALGAVVVSLICEWRWFPFGQDQSFPQFLQQTASLTWGTLLMIAVGALFAFWWGRDTAGWVGRWKPRTVESVENP